MCIDIESYHLDLFCLQETKIAEERWKEVKKVGSLIDYDKDVERRKQLATVALFKLNNVWIKGNKLKTATKIKLYKFLVKSTLL